MMGEKAGSLARVHIVMVKEFSGGAEAYRATLKVVVRAGRSQATAQVFDNRIVGHRAVSAII